MQVSRSVITTVFATDAYSTDVALRSMRHNVEHLSDGQTKFFAAVDLATPELLDYLQSPNAWRVVHPTEEDGEKPPRMTRLLYRTLGLVDTPLTWTIEMDSMLLQSPARVEACMESNARVAAIECAASNANNKMRKTEPTHMRELRDPVWRDDFLSCVGVSFNCTCWRTEVFRDVVDWSTVPILMKADTPLTAQLHRRGYALLLDPLTRCHHQRGVSTTCWRTWKHRRTARA